MTDADETSPGPSPGYRRIQSSRAYENLQRIGAISFPGKRRHGHQHTHSTPVATLSGLSPIPSLSSIATTATSTDSSTLNTPTSTVYSHHTHAIYVRGHSPRDSHSPEVEEDEEDIPTPTPSPKVRQSRVSLSTVPTTSTVAGPNSPSPSTPTANFLRKLSFRRYSASASSSPSPIKLPQRAKPTLAMSVAVPNSVPGSPRAGNRPHGYNNPQDDRYAYTNADPHAHAPTAGVGMGVSDRRGQPHPHLQLPPSQASLSLNLNLRAPKPRRATTAFQGQSMSVPCSPLPSSSAQNQTQMPPSPSQPHRPPSRSERLLRSALLKDEFLAQAAAASSSSSSSSTISSKTQTQTHRRRHSSASGTAAPNRPSSPAKVHPHAHTRRIIVDKLDSEGVEPELEPEVDPALVGASFLFRSAITSAPASSPTRARFRSPYSLSPGRSPALTESPVGGRKEHYTGDTEADNAGGAGTGLGSRSSTPRPGMKNRKSEPNTKSVRHSHGRSLSHNQLPLYEEYRRYQGKRPLTPHEQVLRARLERVLGVGGVALPAGEHSCSSSGSSYGVESDCMCSECTEDEWDRERRRKRGSLPPGYGSGRERAGSGSGFFGLGWLWKGSEGPGSTEGEGGSGEEAEVGSEPEFINPLPTPSTPPSYQYQTAPYHQRGGESVSASPRTPRQMPKEIGGTASPGTGASARRDRSYTSPSPGKHNQNQSPQRHTPRQKSQHVFSLETVPSVDDMRAEFDSGSGSISGAEEGEEGAVPREGRRADDKIGPVEEDRDMRMITPPPTPPRKAGEVSEPALPEESRRSRSRSTASERSSGRREGMGLGLGRPSVRRSNTHRSGSSVSASGSGGSSLERSKEQEGGVVGLGLGLVSPPMTSKMPNGNVLSGSSSSLSASNTSTSMESSMSRGSSPKKPAAATPTNASSPNSNLGSKAKNLDSLSLSPQALSPSQRMFNARTASAQCRLVEGYVSFAEVEGLGEPPASAHPSMCEDGDECFFEGKGGKGGEEGKGWIGRIFGR